MKPIASLVAGAVLACSLGTIAAPVAAAEAPDALVKRVFTDMVEAVKADPALRAGDRRKAAALVESQLLPHIAFQHMTAIAVGRSWRQATPEQQMRLVSEFRDLVVHAYADALLQAADGTPAFVPLRIHPADSDVEVRTQVAMAGAAPLAFGYRLEKGAHEDWKIYDIKVMDAWLVETMKPGFGAEINRGGIDALLAGLRERNRRWEATLLPAQRRQ